MAANEEKNLPFEPLTPNDETIKAIKAVRRGEAIMISNVDNLLASLNDEEDSPCESVQK